LRYALPLKTAGINVRRGFIAEIIDKYGRVAYGISEQAPWFFTKS